MEEQRETEIEKNNLKHSKDTIRPLLVERLVNVQHTIFKNMMNNYA